MLSIPLQLGVLAFVLGVTLLQWQAGLPALQSVLVLLPLFAAAMYCRRQPAPFVLYTGNGLLLLGLVGVGYFWAAGMAHWRLADNLPEDWQGRDIQIVGTIASLPQYDNQKVRFQFDVEQVITAHAVVPGRITLGWYRNRAVRESATGLPELNAGERWQLTVRLKRPHGNINPHTFDYERWAFERGIRANGYVRQNGDSNDNGDNIRRAALVERPGYWIQRARQQIQQRFDRILDERQYAGVLKTLATGDQRAIDTDHWQVFTQTGTNHLMAISGLHITLVASLVYAVVYFLWSNSSFLLLRLPARRAAVAAGVIAALVYAMLSGFGVPAQRAFLMLAVVALALWRNQLMSPSIVLTVALFVVVLVDPWAVLSAGFWLSFGAVTTIMLVSAGRIVVYSKTGRWRGWLRIQWAITLGLVPLLLALFQQFSLVSPLANVVAIPLVGLLVVPLTLLSLLPWLDFLLPLAHEILDVVMRFLHWLNALPQPVWRQHQPIFWTVPVAVAGIIWLLMPGSLGVGFLSGFPARWLGLIAILPLFLVFPPKPPHGALWLTVLDVGQGLAVVARTRHHTLVFDTGPSFGASDSGERVIVPFLRAEGIPRLDKLIVSHADSDHSGGALSVLDGMPVAAFFSSLDRTHAIAEAAARATGNSSQCQAGQIWHWDGVLFEMLHPPQQIYRDAQRKTNPSSCVLKITTHYGSVLIPADIDAPVERALLDRWPEKLPSTVLIAPHHGSLTSSDDAFVRKVNPQVVVFTVGYRNRFGHPRPEVVERYQATQSILLRSDWDGALSLRFKPDGLSVDRWREVHSRYWRQKMPVYDAK